MEQFHGTTIVCVRRGNTVTMGGDGQVTLGNVVFKATARKVRRIYHDRIMDGFAGQFDARGSGASQTVAHRSHVASS